MTETARLITVHRADLFDLGARLVTALPDDVLQDAANPILINVLGSYECGKRIISDSATLSTLWPPRPRRNAGGS